MAGHSGAVYDGIGGDILSAGLMLDEREIEYAAAGRLSEWAEAILDTRCNPLPTEGELSRLLPGPLYERLGRARAHARVLAELSRHREAPNPGGQFYFWNRTRREIALAPYGLLGQGGTVFSPYLDHDLYDFLASLPAEALLDCRLHTEAIARAYPEYAHIPYEVSYAQDWAGRQSQRFFRRWTAETMAALAQRPSRLVRRSALLPGLAARLLTGGGTIARVGPLTAYLLQLEEVSTPAGASAALESRGVRVAAGAPGASTVRVLRDGGGPQRAAHRLQRQSGPQRAESAGRLQVVLDLDVLPRRPGQRRQVISHCVAVPPHRDYRDALFQCGQDRQPQRARRDHEAGDVGGGQDARRGRGVW